MADRMGLDGTTLHYLAVWWAMVSVHRPLYSKTTLTYWITWQTDHCTPQRMWFKVLLNANVALSYRLCSSLHCAYCLKKNPARMGSYYNMATCTDDYATMCPGTVMIHLRSIKSSLPSFYPLCDNLYQALYHFSFCKQAGKCLWTRLAFPCIHFFSACTLS